MTQPPAGTHHVRSTLLIYASIMLAWTLAWLLKVRIIDAQVRWFTTGLGSFLWWTSIKTIVWIVPATWLIRFSGRTLQNVVRLVNWKRAVIWGGGLGLGAALTSLVPAMSGGQPLLLAALSPALLNTLIVAPVYEEFLARGALMGACNSAGLPGLPMLWPPSRLWECTSRAGTARGRSPRSWRSLSAVSCRSLPWGWRLATPCKGAAHCWAALSRIS